MPIHNYLSSLWGRSCPHEGANGPLRRPVFRALNASVPAPSPNCPNPSFPNGVLRWGPAQTVPFRAKKCHFNE